MALLLTNGAVFFHVPKTGGMWVTSVLDELELLQCRLAGKHADIEHVVNCLRHTPLRWVEAAAKAGPGWARRARTAYQFCFVRHPLSWYESYWMFTKARGWPRWSVNRRGRWRWHPNGPLDGLGHDDFNRFIDKLLEDEPGYLTRMYSWYVTDSTNFIGRQERLADDLIAVLRDMDVPFDERLIRMRAPLNAADRSLERPRWDPGLKRELLEAEQEILDRFGYDEAGLRPE